MTTTVHHNSETGATRLVDTARAFRWDEPAGCTSPRGWLMNDLIAACVGFYLDYGPEHYRTGHTTEIYPDKTVSFCRPDKLCRDCQPGNILCVRYPDGPRSDDTTSRYVQTIAEARAWTETGHLPAETTRAA